MNIAVYLSSNFGTDKKIEEQTKKLGEFIGKNQHTLIYGGSKTGLMNVLASSTKDNGGKVIGVETKFFHEKGLSFEYCDEFYLTSSMSERKQMMLSKADAFIALPGGIGTMDEISEVICLDSLSEKHRPLIFMNVNGFYSDLKNQYDKMVEYGYLKKEFRDRIHFLDDVDKLETLLK